MGCRASAGNLNFPITEAIAINGTPTTVHNETGIPRVIFQGTYDNLTAQSMQKFQRRMFGNAAAYNAFIPFLPQRDLESQKAELANVLSVDFETLETGLIKWDKAIVGTDDAIFPPQHQLRYWSSCRDLAFFRDLACKVSTGCPDNVVEIIEMRFPHYPFLNSTDFFLSSFVIQ